MSLSNSETLNQLVIENKAIKNQIKYLEFVLESAVGAPIEYPEGAILDSGAGSRVRLWEYE